MAGVVGKRKEIVTAFLVQHPAVLEVVHAPVVVAAMCFCDAPGSGEMLPPPFGYAYWA